MFKSVTLTDFQSHRNTDLELGPFTVIVGSSSSGKSAVVRALRLVAENARGVTYVRQGAKSCRVSLELAGSEPVQDASNVITVERGKSVSAYTLSVAGMHDRPTEFTKCASGVPDPVVAALGLGESRLWLAGQFDRPYLLDETGAEVARVLGKLTNVNMIYSAVRETNRRASEYRRSYTSKSSDLFEVTAAVAGFASLPGRLSAGQEAEKALGRAEMLSGRLSRLSDRVREAQSARQRVESTQSVVRSAPSVDRMLALSAGRSRLQERVVELTSARSRRSVWTKELRSVPDTGTFDTSLSRRASLREALSELSQVAAVRVRLSETVRGTHAEADAARSRFLKALESAGSCPLCGAPAASAQVSKVL